MPALVALLLLVELAPAQVPPGCVGAASGENTSNSNRATAGLFVDRVTVHLSRTFAGGDRVSFGVPVPPGVNLTSVSSTRVLRSGAPIAASVREILGIHDRCGARTGIRALQIQFDASLMTGSEMDVDVVWRSTLGDAPGTTIVPYGEDRVSTAAPETVTTAVRTITSSGNVNRLVEAAPVQKTLFTSREPHVLASYPDGYLASTGILGQQVTKTEAHQPNLAGLAFLSDAMSTFGLASMYDVGYALNPDADSVVDPVANFEGWLYDRCTTYLTAFAHTNDTRFLREAHRTCRYYASKINLTGPDAGIFNGKPDPDTKYSHLRGLYAYYALSGDELALQAGTAIAQMWYAEPFFTVPYRAGRIRGPDKLWTERLLGTSFEGLYYGHRLTGDAKYLNAFAEMFEVAYRHITGDAATLAAINPGIPVVFPPQNCFIHTAEQHAEGNADQPWCSIWMSELIIDALLRYEEQTGDTRTGEVFVRLARFLRDVGSSSFSGNPIDDYFLYPSIRYDPTNVEDARRLVPLYGSGLGPGLVRRNFGEYSDFEHCSDATALTAAALRALKAQGRYDQNPIGPFASEGASFLQLHHEFSSCAARVFVEQTRPRRDPRVWLSSELAPGLADPATFIRQNKIGYPVGNLAPQRKFSWWFNMSMLQFGLLAEAGISVPALTPGYIQPCSTATWCAPPAIGTQPQGRTIALGQTATMSAISNGSPALGYQWYIGTSGTTTSPIAGATSSSYTTQALTSTTSYWIRVSNAFGSADSNTATIAITDTRPTMSLDTTSRVFSAVTTGAAFSARTAAQVVRLSQAGTGTVTWTAVSTAAWLVVSPTAGTGPATLTISTQFAPGLTSTQAGTITLAFTGTSNVAGPITVTLTVVSSTAAVSGPFGVFDTPAGDATVLAGSIALTGWTLDNVGVQRVEIWRDLQAGETTPPFTSTPSDPRHGKVFIADATFVDGARPDVEALHGTTPFARRAGWGYLLLTRGLWNQGNGTYRMHVYAFDEENNLATIGSKTVVVNNDTATRPFGSIDTPEIGGTASGPNFGWGLTPKVNGEATCKIQSSGVQVSIDSGPLQPVVYGTARTDIAGAFPGFSNTAAAGGHFLFDWATLTNGPHTIGWLITDDCNRAEGVGSRFFNVTTGVSALATAPSEFRLQAEASPDAEFRLKAEATLLNSVASAFRRNEDAVPVLVSRGYGDLPEIVTPDEAGSRTIEVKQGGRIEVRVPRGYPSAYQLVNGGQRRALPAGATWDAASGTFYWEPAAGFLGRYRIVFSNGSERISVRVVVTP